MAQKYGFFNALRNEDGTFDRTYNANDYCDNLAVVIGNGVLRSTGDDLKVTASGMRATVAAGRAWINGHWYLNDSPVTLAAVTAPIGGKRWDRIFLRLNKEVSDRRIYITYVKGTESNSPVKPTPMRTENVYDLVLADIYVDTNATSVSVTDTRADASLCGWVYSTRGNESFFTSLDNDFNEWFGEKKDTLSSVTLFKRYTWRTVLDTISNSIEFDIPQWNEETCFLEVYVNGMLETEGTEYTLDKANCVVTFSGSLVVGTEIIVKIYKSVDGTGIESVGDEITALQNAVANLASEAEYNYHCNSINDNVKLSQIAEAWLNGGTDYASKTVKVFGTFGCSVPYAGAGTSTNPYRWISVGTDSATNRRIVFDFSNCGQISLPITAGTQNTVFYGHNAHIIGASVMASQTGTNTVIHGFNSYSGAVRCENCRFWFTAHRASRVGQTGTFVNCRASIANATENSYCFLPFTDSLLRIEGGEYYAYSGTSSAQSAVVGQSAANSVSILNSVNAPTLARSGFYQTNSVLQWAGGGILSCTDLVSELPLIVVAGISNIRGTIAMSKAGLM
jgi:hypothetical protein